jgi:hypothetical protein
MFESNWVALAAGGLMSVVPLVTLSAGPFSVPDRSRPLNDYIFVGQCVVGPSETTCVNVSTGSAYDLFSGTVYSTFFDLNEERLLANGIIVRYMSCSVALTTLKVDKRGATLAATVLDPSSADCGTGGYSIIDGVYESTGGFQSALIVSAAISSPQFVTSGLSNATRVDNSTGTRSASNCIVGTGENFLQGGFFVNDAFFAMNLGVNSQSRSTYSRCTNLSK